jgi:cell division septal protein FtsQ
MTTAMWFKRKPKNRRLGREHVLDVRLRSSQVRATRTRMATLAVLMVVATVFGVYLAWRSGQWALNRFVYENPAFAVLELDLRTDGVIAVEQLRRWAGVKVGDNLFALDLARVKRDLELVPLIESASVERILPHRLRILITEREPIAQVNVVQPRTRGGVELAVYHLDLNGCVMLPLEARQRLSPPGQTNDVLPVIAGLNPGQLQPGRRIEARPVQAALQLIAAFAQSPMAGVVDLKRIEVSAPEVLVVTTGQGSEVTLGLNDLEQQLRRWHDISEFGSKMNKVIASLDLAVSNNIPARWLEASAAPPPAPKAPKPLRSRKKHV